MRDPRKKSTAGGAHIGFAMFGARGPLLNEHDAGGSAGGGSDTTQQTQQQSSSGNAGQQSNVSFTPEQQAHIDAQIKKAQDAAAANVRRAFEGKAKTGQQPRQEPQPPNAPADDASSLLALRDAFDDAIADMTLAKGQRQLVREAVMSKRMEPQNVDAFVKDFASRAGWSTEQSKTTTAAVTAPVVPDAAAPRAANPVDPVDGNGLVNLFALPAERIAQMSPMQVRGHFDKILEYARSTSGAPPVPRPSTRK